MTGVFINTVIPCQPWMSSVYCFSFCLSFANHVTWFCVSCNNVYVHTITAGGCHIKKSVFLMASRIQPIFSHHVYVIWVVILFFHLCLNWPSCLFPSGFLTKILYLLRLWWVLTEVTNPLTSFSEGFSLPNSHVFQEYNLCYLVRYFVHVMKMSPFDL
jgi:hypothetical protein